MVLTSCADMDLRSGKGDYGICGWMSLSLITCTLLILYFPFAPPFISHNPFSLLPAYDTHIFSGFLLWDPWCMLGYGNRMTVG